MTHSEVIYSPNSLEMQKENDDWIECASVVDSLAYTMKGLSPGSVYRFRVRAENVHGRSEASASSEDVTIAKSANGYASQTFSADIDATDGALFDNDSDIAVVRQGGDFKTRFTLEEELGKGRFGVVHRVVERETGQVLAAKIVKCIKAKDKIKIHEEISIMRSLRHPKLLQLAAAFESAREIVMVME